MGRCSFSWLVSADRGTNRLLVVVRSESPRAGQTALNDHGTLPRSPKKRRQANSPLCAVKEISCQPPPKTPTAILMHRPRVSFARTKAMRTTMTSRTTTPIPMIERRTNDRRWRRLWSRRWSRRGESGGGASARCAIARDRAIVIRRIGFDRKADCGNRRVAFWHFVHQMISVGPALVEGRARKGAWRDLLNRLAVVGNRLGILLLAAIGLRPPLEGDLFVRLWIQPGTPS